MSTYYTWRGGDRGLEDETGKQVLQILAVNCSHKFRNIAGKVLAEKLNTMERGNQFAKDQKARERGES